MAQDRIGGIVRALVGVPQERLAVVQKVVNGLNKEAENGDEFQNELSKFVLGWKPAVPEVVMPLSDLERGLSVYEKLFGKRPEFSETWIPSKPEGFGPMRLIVVAKEIIEWTGNHPLEGVQEALKKHFPGWEYTNDLDADVTTNDRDPRHHSYAVWIRDVPEADEEFANQSANGLKEMGHTGVTLLERLLLEADYFFEKGEHLDQQNWTLCSGSRRRDGSVPDADWNGSEFNVSWYYPSDRNGDLRSRRVWA